jgi:hypothetical protein
MISLVLFFRKLGVTSGSTIELSCLKTRNIETKSCLNPTLPSYLSILVVVKCIRISSLIIGGPRGRKKSWPTLLGVITIAESRLFT